MGATAKDIWRVPAGMFQPPLTPDLVAEAEREIGYRLPHEYLDLLNVQNGGAIRYCHPDAGSGMICGIGPRVPSITTFSWRDSGYQEMVDFELEGLVPFDGDSTFVCLDFRRDANHPSVTYVHPEGGYQNQLAASFHDYLDQLVLDVEGIDYVIPHVGDIDELLTGFEERLGGKFTRTQPDAIGYGDYQMFVGGGPTARLLMGMVGWDQTPQSIWISANRVPSTLVHADDPQAEDQPESAQGDAFQFPELPEASYLIGSTKKVRPKLIEACKRMAVELHSLSEYIS